MNLRFAFCAAFIFISSFIYAQNFTGIWRGYFTSGNTVFQQRYNYEVQIDQIKNKKGSAVQSSLKGVTYSYLSKQFYGKAALHGILNTSTNEITFAEDTLLEVQNQSGFTCLMTCYLQYRKSTTAEILEGTFSSVDIKGKSDCGPGYVYLERVKESDFKKEDFLVKKSSSNTQKPFPNKEKTQSSKAQNNSASASKFSVSAKTKTLLPGGKNFDTTSTAPAATNIAQTINPVQKTLTALPNVIKERENNVVQTITTNSPDIKIELYDNGVIDGDTITVYHNNQLIVNAKELTEKPITINITADSLNAHHEFVMVANNLGKIPPNTALMIVTTGGKRYEVNISEDEKKNAKLVIDYKP